jgi:hypothetical protein
MAKTIAGEAAAVACRGAVWAMARVRLFVGLSSATARDPFRMIGAGGHDPEAAGWTSAGVATDAAGVVK